MPAAPYVPMPPVDLADAHGVGNTEQRTLAPAIRAKNPDGTLYVEPYWPTQRQALINRALNQQ